MSTEAIDAKLTEIGHYTIHEGMLLVKVWARTSPIKEGWRYVGLTALAMDPDRVAYYARCLADTYGVDRALVRCIP